MRSLGDEEVDFILDDLNSKGIVLPDLQDNLLDHICCIIENEITAEDDFYAFYEKVLPQFFKENLKEIQIETDNLLKFKYFYTMKKLLKFSGILTVVLIVIGNIFKSFHLQGAGLLLLLGGFSFSIIFLPLLILIKFKDDESKTDKVVFGIGLLLGMFMSIGLFFKLMHWPYATNLMMYSTLLFTFLYAPLYFITRVKRPELKFNTTVNTVLMIACGGIFYSLFDLSYSHQFSKNMVENHVYIHENTEKLFASNERLLSVEQVDPSAKSLHKNSQSLNNELENIVSLILKHQTTKDLGSKLSELDKKVSNYNLHLTALNTDELKSIDSKYITNLNRLRPELAMNVLARLQQQLAVNENCYLTAVYRH